MRPRTGPLAAGMLPVLATMTAPGCGASGEHREGSGPDESRRPRYGVLMTEVGRRFELVGRTAAATCNGCHEASAHGFIDIPLAPGAAVPKLDPAP